MDKTWRSIYSNGLEYFYDAFMALAIPLIQARDESEATTTEEVENRFAGYLINIAEQARKCGIDTEKQQTMGLSYLERKLSCGFVLERINLARIAVLSGIPAVVKKVFNEGANVNATFDDRHKSYTFFDMVLVDRGERNGLGNFSIPKEKKDDILLILLEQAFDKKILPHHMLFHILDKYFVKSAKKMFRLGFELGDPSTAMDAINAWSNFGIKVVLTKEKEKEIRDTYDRLLDEVSQEMQNLEIQGGNS